MKRGLKLVIIGIILLSYWIVAIYAKIVLIEILILEQESEIPLTSLDSTVNPLEYPWWWLVIRIGDYAGMAGFILVIVGIVKSYIDWRFGK